MSAATGLRCYGCSRSFQPGTYDSSYNDDGELVCPECHGEFVEVFDALQDDPNAGYQHAGQAQQTTSPGGQTFTQRIVGPDGVALNVSIATAVLPGEMYEAFRDRLNMGQPGDGTLMFQMNDTGMMPFAANGSFNLRDFAFGDASWDRIIARLLEAHQPARAPTSQEVINQLPRLPVPPASPKSATAADVPLDTLPTDNSNHAHCRPGEACTVCHEEFVTGGQVLELPCQHCFHEDCILPWLQEHNTCPVCRHKLEQAEPTTIAEPQQHSPGNDSINPNQYGGSLFTSLHMPTLQQQHMQDHLQQQQTGASMPATANALPDVTAAAATARANVSRVATSLTDARTRLDRVQQSIMHLQGQLSERSQQHTHISQEINQLQEQRQEIQARYARLQSEGTQAMQRLSSLLRHHREGNRDGNSSAVASGTTTSGSSSSAASGTTGTSAGASELQHTEAEAVHMENDESALSGSRSAELSVPAAEPSTSAVAAGVPMPAVAVAPSELRQPGRGDSGSSSRLRRPAGRAAAHRPPTPDPVRRRLMSGANVSPTPSSPIAAIASPPRTPLLAGVPGPHLPPLRHVRGDLSAGSSPTAAARPNYSPGFYSSRRSLDRLGSGSQPGSPMPPLPPSAFMAMFPPQGLGFTMSSGSDAGSHASASAMAYSSSLPATAGYGSAFAPSHGNAAASAASTPSAVNVLRSHSVNLPVSSMQSRHAAALPNSVDHPLGVNIQGRSSSSSSEGRLMTPQELHHMADEISAAAAIADSLLADMDVSNAIPRQDNHCAAEQMQNQQHKHQTEQQGQQQQQQQQQVQQQQQQQPVQQQEQLPAQPAHAGGAVAAIKAALSEAALVTTAAVTAAQPNCSSLVSYPVDITPASTPKSVVSDGGNDLGSLGVDNMQMLSLGKHIPLPTHAEDACLEQAQPDSSSSTSDGGGGVAGVFRWLFGRQRSVNHS
eukprot:jgi/Chrzof1/2858/Cz12g01140.t1